MVVRSMRTHHKIILAIGFLLAMIAMVVLMFWQS